MALGCAVLATASVASPALAKDLPPTPVSTLDLVLGYDPGSTPSMAAIARIVGAQNLWAQGYTGQGVDVAVIDTGVARVPGLDGANKVIDGADLSIDAKRPGARYVDAYGHGTHIAGIIAGSDIVPGTSAAGCTTCTGSSVYTDRTKFEGIAPEARIVNVKVGAADGSTDVSQVIAAINWVVDHRNDRGMHIRVINLSYGTDSSQPASIDPLAAAADRAWRAGIVVVAAVGNEGSTTTSLSSPAFAPSIIAVGASNPNGTIDPADDSIPTFSQKGSIARTADVVAPGMSVISLRVPDSYVDANVTAGKVGTRFQQASGSSQATAVVSGVAALMISKFPAASPDVIKYLITNNNKKISLVDRPSTSDTTPAPPAKYRYYAKAGSVDAKKVVGIADLRAYLLAVGYTTPTATFVANGSGSLNTARGSTFLANSDGDMLNTEVDICDNAWPNTASIVTSDDTLTCVDWAGARWSSVDWTGARWTGARWTGARWTGARWSGARWSNARWY